MSNGLDISHWTEWNTGPIEAPEIESMKAHNVERVIVSIAYHDIARRQIEAISAGMPGVEIQTYRYYYWDRWATALPQDEAFIAAMRRDGYDLQFHWIDIEDDSSARRVTENVRDLRTMIDFWTGKCATGIYTAKWVWDSTMPGVTEFSYMPLWYADWDWQEKLELDAPFGGWTVGAMRQTSGDFVMDDVILCDTNYYEKATTPPPVVPPEPSVDHKKRALELLEEATREVEAIDVK